LAKLILRGYFVDPMPCIAFVGTKLNGQNVPMLFVQGKLSLLYIKIHNGVEIQNDQAGIYYLDAGLIKNRPSELIAKEEGLLKAYPPESLAGLVFEQMWNVDDKTPLRLRAINSVKIVYRLGEWGESQGFFSNGIWARLATNEERTYPTSLQELREGYYSLLQRDNGDYFLGDIE
jgi:hypothetical protein